MKTNIIWFRHGLRLHDNPALYEAIADNRNDTRLLPLFIFDGESAGTKCVGYNRMQFLLDSLNDMDQKFRAYGGQLYIISGNPTSIFKRLHSYLGIGKICFEQDCEPIWSKRDNDVKDLCTEMGITVVEKVSHTLWDPRIVIDTNGGIAPLTYQMFLHTVQVIGLPPRPMPEPDWTGVQFINLSDQLRVDLNVFKEVPQPEYFDVFPESLGYVAKVVWKGGETEALRHLKERLKVEENAFKNGFYLPNQANPNILESPKSMSAHLRFGCLSVRRFYWDIHDLFEKVHQSYGYSPSGGAHITGQLIWREYFYTMSVNNPNYDRMEDNEICLTIPWAKTCQDQLIKWKIGETGFPLIDGAMRQLLAEGWLHHCLRNVVSTFLTRGALWQCWEHGLQHFLKYLLDADWSVCAGNWMWVSSSAFETLLDSSLCTCPIALSKRLDPNGEYIKQYIPELANIPKKYIHEPWKAPQDIQEQAECIIGIHYPNRIIDLNAASKQNNMAMKALRSALIAEGAPDDGPPHCRPSNEEEIRHFFWLN